LWEEQVEENMNGILNWDFIWTKPLQDMQKMVKERKRRGDRKNYKEKIDHEIAHYTSEDVIERIEERFFADGLSGNARKTFSSLRNRFVFLMTSHGILRGESVFNGCTPCCWACLPVVMLVERLLDLLLVHMVVERASY
jgi:hypothetical protein